MDIRMDSFQLDIRKETYEAIRYVRKMVSVWKKQFKFYPVSRKLCVPGKSFTSLDED